MSIDFSAFIAGQPVTGNGPAQPVINPATEETLAAIPEAGVDLVDRAAQAARIAFEDGRWHGKSVEERQAMLRRIADVIDAASDELSAIETANTGIPLSQAKARHIARAGHNFRFFADYIGQAAGRIYDQAPDHMTLVRRQPVGVAGLIAPWNAPVALGAMKIAGAIAFGNSCIIKPSEQAPLGVHKLVELIHRAGLPEGVVNLVSGRGAVTGDALVRHPEVDLVSFTGGTTTGRAIMSAAGQMLKPSTMELGGKSANIIFDSADFDQAVDGALLGIFTNNGQQCLAGSRILVQRSIADRFITAFLERVARLRIGSPLDAGTELGPVASSAHRDRILSYADTARREGMQILAGGRAHSGFDKGFYLEPTVALTDDPGATVCREEIFGPFATILLFDTPDDAFRIANATRFGLVSYVWTQDIYLALRAQEELQSGVVWINTPMMRELRAPFGGWKESGVGAEGGLDCEAFYTRQKTITLARHPLALRRMGTA
ncbi:aldehyde dehydrogenase [Niveispirillum irakense]|uniref:aldehyde dehydrogenase n=1 Tax=Niveispirillum irakense TaxID=34011 RepID=UPI0004089FA4|nr:aldehyde dehydrogenase [Niveispirillum irakense]